MGRLQRATPISMPPTDGRLRAGDDRVQMCVSFWATG